jgi:predicted phage tail protein
VNATEQGVALPSVPLNVRPIVQSPLAITFNWSAPADTGLGPSVTPARPLTVYLLQLLTQTSASESPDLSAGAAHTLSGITTTFRITGLVEGYFYYFRVRAVNSAGLGNWSTPVFERGVQLPNAVQAVSARCVLPFTINVSWVQPLNTGLGPGQANRLFEVGGYLLEVALVANFSAPAAILVNGNETSRVLSGLIKGQRYFYRIRARNSAGDVAI